MSAPTRATASTPVPWAGARRLPDWGPWAVALGALLITVLLFAVTPLQGRADFALVAVLAFLVAMTAVAWAVEGSRRAKDRIAGLLAATALGLALLPLAGILAFVIARGARRFDATFFTHSLRSIGPADVGGGAYHSILGTVEQVGIATAISVPLGLLVSIYLVEYSRGGRFGRLVSTFVDVMTGLPSIVAGLFILSFWLLALHQSFTGFAGSLALTILMLPLVVRTTEEILRLVPDALREASTALGIPRWRTVTKVVLPTALPGITTGVLLAIARASGETAPLLLTIFGNNSINNNPFSGAQDALPLFVFTQAAQPNAPAVDRAWTGALTLIILVVALNVAARLLTARRAVRDR